MSIRKNITNKTKARYQNIVENTTNNTTRTRHFNRKNITRGKECTCGCSITKRLLSNHKNTRKHLMKIGVSKYECIDDNG